MRRLLAALAAAVLVAGLAAGLSAGPNAGPASAQAPTTRAWNPPANLVQPLDEVWRHVESTYPNLYGFRNYGWDQIMANGGYVHYCVRWDSSAPVSAALRDRIHAALARQFAKWMDVMVENGQGWEGWPYRTVPVRVVGWAVRDRATLQWTDDSVDIYVNDINENAPQCARRAAGSSTRTATTPSAPAGRPGTTTCRCG